MVLGGLARQTPAEALAALEAGAPDGGELTAEETLARRTEDIVASVNYAFSNVDEEAQALLLCLAPFSGAFNTDWLPQYIAQLQQQPALADLPFGDFIRVLLDAERWGLTGPHPIGGGYRRLQPVFPYFLRGRLAGTAEAARRAAIDAAFVAQYNELGAALAGGHSGRKKPGRGRRGWRWHGWSTTTCTGHCSGHWRLPCHFMEAFEAPYELLLQTNGHEGCKHLCGGRSGLGADSTTNYRCLVDLGVHFYR